jgi:alpha-ketoglutarate-dependent taurine dioxygenase
MVRRSASPERQTAGPPEASMTITTRRSSGSIGDETRFTNVMADSERLREDLRRRIAGLEALHLLDERNATTRRCRAAAAPRDAPREIHPVVETHPTTGRPIL